MNYRVAVSGLVTHVGPRDPHEWALLRDLPVRRFELSMLRDAAELERFQEVLRPDGFGVHWPLYAEDPRRLDLMAPDDGACARALERVEARLAGSGADYVLVHFPERREPWPDPGAVARRLEALAGLGRRLGMRIALEPKEAVGGVPDGVCAFARGVAALPPGLALCMDVSDWQTAGDNLGGPPPLRVGAAQVHLHARHVQPGGPFYRHAAPWVRLRPEPGWTVRNVGAADLEALVARDEPVQICLEVVHHYLDLLPEALAAVRRILGERGWTEAPGGAAAR